MSKMITVRNPAHPKTLMEDHGQRAKEAARKLSNEDLDRLFSSVIPIAVGLKEVLSLTRAEKIRLVRKCAMDNFAEDWNKAQEAAEGKK